MHQPIKTPKAAENLGITYHRLIDLIRYRKIAAPQKDSSGDYLWSEADLSAARVALNQRDSQPRGKVIT